MLSRVEDVRVFESSDDVILRSSSRRYPQQQFHSREQTEIEEDEQLHPQHPYRMRKCVLQQESEEFQSLDEKKDHMLVSSNTERNRPMEFVFLSSGEIRAREDCPPGLGLPRLQQEQDYKSAVIHRRLEYQEEDSEESEEEDKEPRRSNKQVMQVSRQQVGRQPSARHNERYAASLSFPSGRSQIAANSETSSKIRDVAREKEEKIQSTEKDQAARINVLEEQARLQEAKIFRLKQDKDQLKTVLKQLKKTGSNLSNDQLSDAREVLDMRTEVEDVTRHLHEFLAKVELWKNNSKKDMQSCDGKTDLPALLEHVWLDFPQFPGVSSRPRKESLSPTSDKQQESTPGATDEQGDAILFLKKRLRQREDELRQIHVKYVELKELCARQCVREADLQNFINEHRLRGNLVIRKNSGVKPNSTIDNQEQEQDGHQDEQRPSARLKMISIRGTNIPASYERDEENKFINDEHLDNQEDNDDNEEEEAEYPVHTPKIFVQVGRDGVYEHASPTNSAVAQKLAADRNRGKRNTQSKQQQQRIERIRLVPSPSLTQQYERVPTPTTTARRKKSVHQPLSQSQSSSRYNPAMLGECPPGCGSRLSFMRRKTPTAARAMPVKRPVATTASKGAIGVIRPWM